MLRLNLQVYRGPSELLVDRTFEQELVRIGPGSDCDLSLGDSEPGMPTLRVGYSHGAYRLTAEGDARSLRLNSAPMVDSTEGTVLSHEDLITIGRISLVVRIYSEGGSDLASPLWLLGIAGPLFGYAAEVRASTVIGRQAKGPSEADILLPAVDAADEALSRQHARLTWMPGDVVEYRDISRHAEEIGSWVNRRRAERGLTLPVRPGDELMIGKWGRHIFRLARHGEWDFRPPQRVPAGKLVFGGWVARFVLPIGGAVLLAAGAAAIALQQAVPGIVLAAVGAGLLGIWRARLVRRRLAVQAQGRKLEGWLRV